MKKLVKYLFCFVLLASASMENCTLLAQSDFVLSGSNLKVVIDGSALVVIDNLSFKNDASSTFWGGTGEMVFQGNQTVSVGGTFESRYKNLTIDKPNTTLTLNTPVVVTQELTMTAGNIVTTSSNLLTIGTSTVSPGIITWTGGTIIGPLERYFSATASATQSSGIFPVGLSTSNRFAQVNYTAGLTAGGTITAEYAPGVCPIGLLGLPTAVNGKMIINNENQGFWKITPIGGNLNLATYSLILRGNNLGSVIAAPNTNQLRIIKSVGHSTWDNAGLGAHTAPVGNVADFTIANTGMSGFSWFNVGSGNPSALPVTLIDLSANCNEKAEVDIFWSNASEKNTAKFIVEKNRDLINWQTVAEKSAAGNSNYLIEYVQADTNPFEGISYYQLRQIDFNGAESKFGPISASCSDTENGMIVFPNPTQGNFTVEISSTEIFTDAQLQITDLTGKVINERLTNILEGKNQFTFEGLDLQLGTYIVQLNSLNDNFRPVRIVVE